MTNEEIQVGECVRTKRGFIGKVINVNDFRPPEAIFAIEYGGDDYGFAGYEDIRSHSFNIIDLIEIGDYVNGVEVIEIDEKTIRGEKMIETNCEGNNSTRYFVNDEIKTIITHEQMKSMEYKVGGEKCINLL